MLFLVSTLVGVWAAYDRTAAWYRFGLEVAAIAIYYALVATRVLGAESPRSEDESLSEPRRATAMVSCICVAVSSLVVVAFLVQENIRNYLALRISPSEIGPPPVQPLEPHSVAACVELVLPISFALCLHFWRDRSHRRLVAAAALTALLISGLIVAGAVSTILVLTIPFGLLLLWSCNSCLEQLCGNKHRWVAMLGMGVFAVLLATLLSTRTPGQIARAQELFAARILANGRRK